MNPGSAATGERRLAAIMFTDVAGFTVLTQRDEGLALQLPEELGGPVRSLLLEHSGP